MCQVLCVDQFCDQLCYCLELVYFVVCLIKGVDGQLVSIRIFNKGGCFKVEDIEGFVDFFVVNLVFEWLIFYFFIWVGLFVFYVNVC